MRSGVGWWSTTDDGKAPENRFFDRLITSMVLELKVPLFSDLSLHICNMPLFWTSLTE
jgi:hypothetical protein